MKKIFTLLVIFLTTQMSGQVLRVDENTKEFYENNQVNAYKVIERDVYDFVNENRIYKLKKMLKDSERQNKILLEDYNKRVKRIDDHNGKVYSIINGLESYLKNPSKSKHKQDILIENQLKLDSLGIDIIRVKEIKYHNSMMVSKDKRRVNIYDGGSKKSDEDILFIIDELKKIIENKTYPTKPHFLDVQKEIDSLSQYKTKRKSYVVDSTPVEMASLKGDFSVVYENFDVLHNNTYDDSNKPLNEGKESPYSYQTNPRKNPLIKSSNGEMYFIRKDGIVYEYQKFTDELKALEFVKGLGYKPYKLNPLESEYWYIDTKQTQLRVGEWLLEEINDDPNFINKLDSNIQKFKNLVNDSKPNLNKLINHFRLYNIQRNKLSTNEINAWVQTTNNSEKQYDKMYQLLMNYDHIPFTILDKKSVIEFGEFRDYIFTSKTFLNI